MKKLLFICLLFPSLVQAQSYEIPRLIGLEASRWGLDPTLALSIAYAESGYHNVPNYINDSTHTAYGIFQLTKTFYRTFCGDPEERLIPEKNIACAIKVMATQQNPYLHWIESYEMHGRGWKYLPHLSTGA